jgi:hypothetical protein
VTFLAALDRGGRPLARSVLLGVLGLAAPHERSLALSTCNRGRRSRPLRSRALAAGGFFRPRLTRTPTSVLGNQPIGPLARGDSVGVACANLSAGTYTIFVGSWWVPGPRLPRLRVERLGRVRAQTRVSLGPQRVCGL